MEDTVTRIVKSDARVNVFACMPTDSLMHQFRRLLLCLVRKSKALLFFAMLQSSTIEKYGQALVFNYCFLSFWGRGSRYRRMTLSRRPYWPHLINVC